MRSGSHESQSYCHNVTGDARAVESVAVVLVKDIGDESCKFVPACMHQHKCVVPIPESFVLNNRDKGLQIKAMNWVIFGP